MRSSTSSGLIGSQVDLLHAPGGLLVVELGDLLEERLGVLVAGPEAFEVEHAERRRGGRSRWRWPGETTPSMAEAMSGQLEAEGVDLPGDVDVLGVAGAPARARWRCRRTRRPGGRTCPGRSRPQPCAALSFSLARRDRSYRRSYGGADDPPTAGRRAAHAGRGRRRPPSRTRRTTPPTTTLPVDAGNHSVIPAPELRPGADRSRGPRRMGAAPAVRRALRGLGDRLRPRPLGRPPAQPGQPHPLTGRCQGGRAVTAATALISGPDAPMASTRARVRPGRGHRFGLLVRACDLAAPTSNPSRPERALDPVRAGRGVGAPGVSGGRRRIDVTAVSARWSFPFCAHACDHGSYLLQTSRSS